MASALQECDIVIASAAYPGSEPYLSNFFESIKTATNGYKNVRLALTCENIPNLPSLASHTGLNNIHIANIPQGLTLGKARELLFSFAKHHTRQICIFIDSDDMLTPEAVNLYLNALKNADFACGNMALVNDAGEKLNCRPLYNEWSVSGSITSTDTLLNGNIIGLGAVALNKHCLHHIPNTIPKNIIGVDWWVFHHLLTERFQGTFIKEPTIYYRQHANNVSGIFTTNNVALLRKRAKIAIAHYANIENTNEVSIRLKALEQYIRFLDEGKKTDIPQANKNRPIPWYSDVIEQSLKMLG